MCFNMNMNASWFEMSIIITCLESIESQRCFGRGNLPQIEGRQKNWYQPQGRLLPAGDRHETIEAGQTIEAITPMTPVYSEDMSCRNWILITGRSAWLP